MLSENSEQGISRGTGWDGSWTGEGREPHYYVWGTGRPTEPRYGTGKPRRVRLVEGQGLSEDQNGLGNLAKTKQDGVSAARAPRPAPPRPLPNYWRRALQVLQQTDNQGILDSVPSPHQGGPESSACWELLMKYP